MKICKGLILLSLVLVLMLSAPVAFGQSTAPPTSSVSVSTKSDIPASLNVALPSAAAKQPAPAPTPPDIGNIINACAATADDLKAQRAYANGLETENKLLYERLETEKRANAVLLELDSTRRDAMASLRSALEAKNETIAAKDEVIRGQDKLVTALKSKKPSLLKRIGDVAIGAAIIAILK